MCQMKMADVPLGCFSGLKLVVMFELIGNLLQSNVTSFFEYNMRFYVIPLHYAFKLIGFRPKEHGQNASIFRVFVNLKQITYFLVGAHHNNYIRLNYQY